MKSLLKAIVLGVTFAVMLALTGSIGGCSSSGNGSSTSTSQTPTGVFVDVPVQGISYEFGSYVGVTGIGGTFSYHEGDQGVFKVGDIVIGKAIGAPVISLVDVARMADPVSDDSASQAEAVRLVQFLMTLDDGTNQAYITIPPTVMNFATGTRFVGVDLLKDDLQFIIDDIKPGATLVDPATAAKYLADSLNNVYIRAHAGEYMSSNPDNGAAVELSIQPDGSLIGIARSEREGEIYQLSGSVASGGDLTINVIDYETKEPVNVIVAGKSDGMGTVSGKVFIPPAGADTTANIANDIVTGDATTFSLQRVARIDQ
jgi:hypothetical protein